MNSPQEAKLKKPAMDHILKPYGLSYDHNKAIEKIILLYKDLFYHDGYGSLRIEMRFLKKKQKEIILYCGKEYRFVMDYSSE